MEARSASALQAFLRGVGLSGLTLALSLVFAPGAAAQATLRMAPPWTVGESQKISDTTGGLTAALDGSDFFGISCSALGDLDGDGLQEIAVGGTADDDGGQDRGAVFVLSLNADGTVAAETKISASSGGLGSVLADFDFFGRSVAGMGDLDGDGVGDLAVGAYRDDDGGMDRGAVYVLLLNTDGSVKSSQKISQTTGGFGGTLANVDFFGISVANLGDLDGDGRNDLAVGSQFDDGTGTDRGSVWILFLNANGTVKAEREIGDGTGGFTGTLQDNDNFGAAVAGLGDLNGDGVPDLAVGANGDDDGGSGRGAVWILFLATDGKALGWSKISDTAGGFTGELDDADNFGTALGMLGDVDGNGLPDLAAGAWRDDDGGLERGAFWILELESDGTVAFQRKISDTRGGLGGLDDGDGFGISIAAVVPGGKRLMSGAFGDDDGGTDVGALHVLDIDNVPTAGLAGPRTPHPLAPAAREVQAVPPPDTRVAFLWLGHPQASGSPGPGLLPIAEALVAIADDGRPFFFELPPAGWSAGLSVQAAFLSEDGLSWTRVLRLE